MPTEPLPGCFFCEGIYFIVDERAGDETAELIVAVVVKFIFEHYVPPIWQESVHTTWENRFPCDAGDAGVDGLTVVILACPPGEFAIIGRSAPFSGRGIDPERSVSCMSGSENGCVAERGDGVYDTFALCRYFQFVGNGRG